MSCETKSSQYYSIRNQIPTFGPTGNLPPFDKAAHTNKMMNSIPHQNKYQNKRSFFPENFSVESIVPDRPVTSIPRQDNSGLRGPIEIDLTCERRQLPSRNIDNRQQVQTNSPYLNYNVSGGSNFNDQSIQTTQTRFPQDPKSIVSGQTYPQQLTQSNHYSHANPTQNQQKLPTTAQNTAPKISPENILKNLQNSTINSQITNVPYISNELLQQPRDKYLQTREPHLSAIHTGEERLKNQINISQVYKNPQQNSYQFNTYGKETNFFPKPQMSEKFTQNNDFQGKYNSSQNCYKMKPREIMDQKSEKVIINGRQIQPKSIQQEISHGRSVVLNETTATSEYLAAQLYNHRVSQYDCKRMNMNRYHGDTQTPNYAQKINPTLDTRQYQNQNLSTHTLQTAPRPMTTPMPTIISEDSTSWSNQISHVPRFYDYSNETLTVRQLEEDIIYSVEEVTRNSKYSQNPEAKREIELIKDKLMVETYQDSYSSYPYAQPEYSSITRKRPNEMSQDQSLKKQTLSTQNPHLNFQDFSVESPPNTSFQFYKDINTHNSVQHQTPKFAAHFNSEMNQIVPTSNSVHSSPRSNKNHDSPGTDLNSMKKGDDIDRYYCN